MQILQIGLKGLILFVTIVICLALIVLAFLGLLYPLYLALFTDQSKLMIHLLTVATTPALVAGVLFLWFVMQYREEIRSILRRFREGFGIKVEPPDRASIISMAGSIPEGATLDDVLENAKAESAEDQLRLGLIYYLGAEVRQNAVEAARWYRRAAEQGLARAQYNLGLLYDLGEGVPEDHVEAVKWYRLAADQEDAQAQYKLGLSYDIGQGVAQDHAKAVELWRRAADFGNAEAQYSLGVICDSGEGVPQDHAAAVEWYRRAAEQGLYRAQHALSEKYASGQGVSQSWPEAYIWSSIAAAEGLWSAAEVRDTAAKALSPDDLASARQEAERRHEDTQNKNR